MKLTETNTDQSKGLLVSVNSELNTFLDSKTRVCQDIAKEK